MSEASEKEYDQGYEDGYHNAAMTRVHAVDRLESQNQALQELLKDCAYLLEHAAFSEGLGFSEIVRDVQRRIAERDPSPTQED